MLNSLYVGQERDAWTIPPAKLGGDDHPARFSRNASIGFHLLPWKFSLSCPRDMLRNILLDVLTLMGPGRGSRYLDTCYFLVPL